jgi:DNA repair exonuclease SbcCD nuclease subunit
MDRVFVTGDTHGVFSRFNSRNWVLGRSLDKGDYLIIAGDVGLLWSGLVEKDEIYWIKWFDNKPWITLFVDGNHDNHERLQALEIKSKFGGMVGRVSDSVYHLRRGEIYRLAGKKIFTFGGALSIDKHHRTEGISYWRNEIASHKEMEHGLQELERHNYSVDYIITHTCPITISQIICAGFFEKQKDITCGYLEQVDRLTDFKRWYFGHWHIDRNLSKYTAIYQKINEIGG